jgi:hypothetical protein
MEKYQIVVRTSPEYNNDESTIDRLLSPDVVRGICLMRSLLFPASPDKYVSIYRYQGGFRPVGCGNLKSLILLSGEEAFEYDPRVDRPLTEKPVPIFKVDLPHGVFIVQIPSVDVYDGMSLILTKFGLRPRDHFFQL